MEEGCHEQCWELFWLPIGSSKKKQQHIFICQRNYRLARIWLAHLVLWVLFAKIPNISMSWNRKMQKNAWTNILISLHFEMCLHVCVSRNSYTQGSFPVLSSLGFVTAHAKPWWRKLLCVYKMCLWDKIIWYTDHTQLAYFKLHWKEYTTDEGGKWGEKEKEAMWHYPWKLQNR